MVLYWSWIMSHQSKTYHGQSSVLLFQPLVDDDTAHITADFLCHHISSLEKQRDKLDIVKWGKDGTL